MAVEPVDKVGSEVILTAFRLEMTAILAESVLILAELADELSIS